MKKLVPDPPAVLRGTTTHMPFAYLDGQPVPLIAVCAGSEIEPALKQLSRLICSAYETNLLACDNVGLQIEDILWSTQFTLETSRALIGSILAGIEVQRGAIGACGG